MNQNEQLHKTLVEILDFAKEICEEHKLTYFLVYGTALGARRHSGFIPWDDDVDIALPRKDYEQFLRLVAEKKDSSYTVQNEDNEENYFLTFAKVRKKNTVFIESILEAEYKDNGIYIDIFPLDFVENPNSVGFKLRRGMFDYLKHILKFSTCRKLYKTKYSPLRYALEHILALPAFVFSNKSLLKMANRFIHSTQEAAYVGQYDQTSVEAIMPYDYYFPAAQATFEGKEYSVPAKLDKYLEHSYGSDFMELPPVEKRVTHNPVKLIF